MSSENNLAPSQDFDQLVRMYGAIYGSDFGDFILQNRQETMTETFAVAVRDVPRELTHIFAYCVYNRLAMYSIPDDERAKLVGIFEKSLSQLDEESYPSNFASLHTYIKDGIKEKRFVPKAARFVQKAVELINTHGSLEKPLAVKRHGTNLVLHHVHPRPSLEQ